MKEGILVLLRHGQSEWNKKNVFTGWVDVPLSTQGIKEAIDAGKAINEIPFEVVFTSTLVRAQMTAFLAMSQHVEGKTPIVIDPANKQGKIKSQKMESEILPVYYASELNERMYGDLQGKNKDEMRQEFGEEQVQKWRRSFSTRPPNGESLQMTCERTLPYFEEKIIPYLKRGQNVLIAAHGNSLRSIIMSLEGLSEDEVVSLEVPTGHPLCYVFNKGQFQKASVETCRGLSQNSTQ